MLCDSIDGSPTGSAVLGILQARTLEWVAISFSSAWKWKVKVKSLSRVWLLATPWTAAYQAPLSRPWDFPGKSTGVGSAYLRLLIFLLAILILACASSSPAFCMMYSAYKLNTQGDYIQSCCTPLPIWNQSIVLCPVLAVTSWPEHRFSGGRRASLVFPCLEKFATVGYDPHSQRL